MNAFYASEWQDCPEGGVRDVCSPWSGEAIETVPVCHPGTVDKAIVALKQGVRGLSEISNEGLGKVFLKAAEMLKESSHDMATLITREQGKPISESLQEVAVTINLMESFGHESYRLGRQFLSLAVEARVGERFGFTRRRPMGITALLTPNTFPLLTVAKLVLPSLAAGNGVVIKPASQTPFSALGLVESLLESGLPPGTIACLTGPGEITGQAVCRHPLVDHVSCYGGMESIRAIRSVIGLIPLRFHHGGMSVCVVLDDADLDRAVRSIIEQGFENSGQTAISAGAVFATERIYDSLIERLGAAIRNLPCGNPETPGTRIGPLTEPVRAQRATGIVGELMERGARKIVGSGMSEGNLFEPVLLADVDPMDPSFYPQSRSRELLSPIMGITRLTGDPMQIGEWLEPRTQIAVTIFSNDLDRATQLAAALPVYNVHINGLPTWRDGLLFNSQAGLRLGRRKSEQRVNDVTSLQDIVFHP
ncbi:MAG: aldehyde dehydrogenase family protein [Verrucomicrobiales bacterium]|nr:aldehyde dehydrogenase family protein [Verrucomicrobiales bacterium]